MTLVKVGKKHQVVIPHRLRRQLGLKAGDLLTATVQRGRIMFARATELDKGLARSFEDVRQGRTYGPFVSAEDTIAALKDHLRRRSPTRGRAA